MDIVYRKMDFGDVSECTELRKAALIENGERPDADIDGALAGYYNAHLGDGSFVSWLAILGGGIIATSGMSFVEKPPYFACPSGRIGLLSSMYTKPEHRRKGVAGRLLGMVVEEARKHGCCAVQITASDVGVLLYQNFGFTKTRGFYISNFRFYLKRRLLWRTGNPDCT